MRHIVVDQEHPAETTYPINTEEQTAKARAALDEAGVECAHVYVGEGPDAYVTGALLWATPCPVYRLRRATDGTYAWHADGPEIGVPFSTSKLPDMQLLGYDETEVIDGAARWLVSRGIDAVVVLA